MLGGGETPLTDVTDVYKIQRLIFVCNLICVFCSANGSILLTSTPVYLTGSSSLLKDIFNQDDSLIRRAVFQVEASTKLFPAVFIRPTSNCMFQFEFGCIKVKSYLPCLLDSYLFLAS